MIDHADGAGVPLGGHLGEVVVDVGGRRGLLVEGRVLLQRLDVLRVVDGGGLLAGVPERRDAGLPVHGVEGLGDGSGAAADGVAERVLALVCQLAGGLVERVPRRRLVEPGVLEQVGAVVEDAVVGGGRQRVQGAVAAACGLHGLDHVLVELAVQGGPREPVVQRFQGSLGGEAREHRRRDAADVRQAATLDGGVDLGLVLGGGDPDVLDVDVRVRLLEVGDDLLPHGRTDAAVVVPEDDLPRAAALGALAAARSAAVVAAGGGGQGEDGPQRDGGRCPACAGTRTENADLHWSALFFSSNGAVGLNGERGRA